MELCVNKEISKIKSLTTLKNAFCDNTFMLFSISKCLFTHFHFFKIFFYIKYSNIRTDFIYICTIGMMVITLGFKSQISPPYFFLYFCQSTVQLITLHT